MAQAADGPGADVAGGLLQLATAVQAIYACVSERHDLTPAQARLLCVLLDGPRGMAELAQRFGFGFRGFGQTRRIVEADVHAPMISGNCRASLVGIPADGDDIIKLYGFQVADAF